MSERERYPAGVPCWVETLQEDPRGALNRMAVLADPAGAPICVWEARAREGAQLVNEPRAWAMSLLHTTDPERSKAFYGAVFSVSKLTGVS